MTADQQHPKTNESKGLFQGSFTEEKPWIELTAQMHDHSMTVAGVPAREFYYDARTMVDTTAKVAAYYEMDGFQAFADAYNFEIEGMGGKMIYSDNAMPTIDFREPLIKEPKDLLKLKTPDFFKDGRLPYAMDSVKFATEYGVYQGIFCAPFSMAVGMRGYPTLIKDLRKRPDFYNDLFIFIVDEVLTPYVKAQNEYAGVPVAVGADAWADIPNLSVEQLKECVVPYNQRLMEKAKESGMMAMCVTGDYCEERVEKFDAEVLHGSFDVEIASQGFPSLLLGMGRWHEYPLSAVRDYTAKYREQGIPVAITAGVNARLLRNGPVEAIVDNVKRFIDTFARDHNLTLFLANIPADAPSEHIHAAVQAAHVYGRKPIADNLDDIKFELRERETFAEWQKAQLASA